MTLSFDPRPPRLEDLCRDPVLAILAALDATLILSIHALIATHPYAHDEERPYWIEPLLAPSDRVASNIIMFARQLRDALESYRTAIAWEHRSPNDDDPQASFPF